VPSKSDVICSLQSVDDFRVEVDYELPQIHQRVEDMCATCYGRGSIIVIQGIFRARMTCHSCQGKGRALLV